MEIGAMVRHRQHGEGKIRVLFASTFGTGNAGVDFAAGVKIVGINSLTRIEPGEQSESEPEQGADLRADNPKVEIEAIDSTHDNPEPSQSQLRKQPDQADHDGLPAWPSAKRKSQSKGQRVRLTNEQTVVLEEQIEQRLVQGFKPAAIADELLPWCKQKRTALQSRIRSVRTRIEAGQEVAA